MKLKRLIDLFELYTHHKIPENNEYDEFDAAPEITEDEFLSIGDLNKGDLVVVIRSFEDEHFCISKLGTGWIVDTPQLMEDVE